jgi:hypothetical protein
LSLLFVVALDYLTDALTILATLWWVASWLFFTQSEKSCPIVRHALVDDALGYLGIATREVAKHC